MVVATGLSATSAVLRVRGGILAQSATLSLSQVASGAAIIGGAIWRVARILSWFALGWNVALS